jgi:hypothetical protein
MDESKLVFWTGANYMKRLLQDSQNFSISASANQTIPVAHGLGHIPGEFMVAVDIANDGTLWVNSPYYHEFDTPIYPTFNVWTDNNTLTIYLDNQTVSTKLGTAYWVIYMDYS